MNFFETSFRHTRCVYFLFFNVRSIFSAALSYKLGLQPSRTLRPKREDTREIEGARGSREMRRGKRERRTRLARIRASRINHGTPRQRETRRIMRCVDLFIICGHVSHSRERAGRAGTRSYSLSAPAGASWVETPVLCLLVIP